LREGSQSAGRKGRYYTVSRLRTAPCKAGGLNLLRTGANVAAAPWKAPGQYVKRRVGPQ